MEEVIIVRDYEQIMVAAGLAIIAGLLLTYGLSGGV